MRREDQLALLKSTPLDEQTINALIEAFGSPKITKDKVDEAFDDFWKWYPKRAISHSKKGAYENFRKIVATGIDPQALAHTAKSYRKEMERAGNIGTNYVKMATTFLGKEKPVWQEHMPKGEEHKWELKPKTEGHPDGGDGYEVWRRVCFTLKAEFGEKTYRSYFDNLVLIESNPDWITLRADSPFMANKIAMEYGNRLSDIAGCPVRVVS